MGKKKSFIILLILAILATGGVICMNSEELQETSTI